MLKEKIVTGLDITILPSFEVFRGEAKYASSRK